jgi:hypothetical protein
VQSTGSKTLILSGDPACTVSNGDKWTFPPATLCEYNCSALLMTVGETWLLDCQSTLCHPVASLASWDYDQDTSQQMLMLPPFPTILARVPPHLLLWKDIAIIHLGSV